MLVIPESNFRKTPITLTLQAMVRQGHSGRATVPALLTRAGQIADQMDEATRNGLVLAPETVAALTTAGRRARRWQTLALWAIVALLGGLLILAFR